MADWRPEEGSFRSLWKALFVEQDKLHILNAFINRFPVYTYPLGEKSYWRSVDKYGQESVLSPHNTWRAVCHTAFGAIISLPFLWLAWWVTPSVVLVAFACKEFLSDARETGIDAKNFYDAACWTVGSLIACLFF